MREALRALRRSIAARLFAVMLALTLLVPAAVLVVATVTVRPWLSRSAAALVEAYAAALAAAGPGRDDALGLARRLGLEVRYQGPAGGWATRPGLPAPTPGAPGVDGCGPDCWQVRRADGGAYLFRWAPYREARAAHDRALLGLAAGLIALIAAAHVILQRTLAPLRGLRRGVAALGAGDLDVALPRRGADELGALTDAFNGMVAEVRGMVRARDQLLLDVSHELRSPLTRMKVALALQPEGPLRGRLEADVAQMEAMVSSLLELERLRAGRGLERRRHDLAALLREAARAFADRPPGLALSPPPGPLWLELDPDRIRTVLDNLLENAFKYALPDSAPVALSAAAGPEGVVVSVEDDGPGLPPEALERVFEPFYRLDPSRSRRTGGFGLGLPLCRRIVEAHGGAIHAERRPGRGCRMVFTLPLPAQADGAAVRSSRARAARSSRAG